MKNTLSLPYLFCEKNIGPGSSITIASAIIAYTGDSNMSAVNDIALARNGFIVVTYSDSSFFLISVIEYYNIDIITIP